MQSKGDCMNRLSNKELKQILLSHGIEIVSEMENHFMIRSSYFDGEILEIRKTAKHVFGVLGY